MLRAIIISPDKELADSLEDVLYEVGHVGIIRRMDRYPDAMELSRFLRVHAPQLVFLCVDALAAAQDMAQTLEAQMPGIQVAAISRSCDPQVLLQLMRSGIREFLSMPFDTSIVSSAIDRISDQVIKKPPALERTNLLFSFLPAKAGVGTSTIAVNTASAFARQPDSKTLLADFDLNSGIVRFMLKLENPRCIVDAAEFAVHMDETLWPQLVTNLDQLDVLHAGTMNPGFRFEPAHIRYLLEFARRTYKSICVDLSGNMEKYSLDLMQESKVIYLVTTQEIPALHLAREKMCYLRSLELADRVTILINRAHKKAGITPEQVEELLGAPVKFSFPNDYLGVHKALTAGRVVDPSSELGKRYTALAHSFVDAPPQDQPEHKRRFVEYFSLVPARYSLTDKRGN